MLQTQNSEPVTAQPLSELWFLWLVWWMPDGRHSTNYKCCCCNAPIAVLLRNSWGNLHLDRLREPNAKLPGAEPKGKLCGEGMRQLLRHYTQQSPHPLPAGIYLVRLRSPLQSKLRMQPTERTFQLITRTVHNGFPPSVDYSITEHGNSLHVLISGLRDWGEIHRKKIMGK